MAVGEVSYVKNEVEVVAKVYSSGRVLGRPVAHDDVVTLPCDTEVEARAIGKALRSNLAVDHVELVHRTLRVTERSERV